MQGFLPLSFGHSRKWRRGWGSIRLPLSPPSRHTVWREHTHTCTHTHQFNQRKSCGEENDNNPTFYDCSRLWCRSVVAYRERRKKNMCSVVTQGKTARYLPLFPHGFSLYIRTCVLLCEGKNCTNPAEAVASPFSSSFPFPQPTSVSLIFLPRTYSIPN